MSVNSMLQDPAIMRLADEVLLLAAERLEIKRYSARTISERAQFDPTIRRYIGNGNEGVCVAISRACDVLDVGFLMGADWLDRTLEKHLVWQLAEWFKPDGVNENAHWWPRLVGDFDRDGEVQEARILAVLLLREILTDGAAPDHHWPDYPEQPFHHVRMKETYYNLHGVLIALAGAEGNIRSEDRGIYGIDFGYDTRALADLHGHRFHSIPYHLFDFVYKKHEHPQTS